MNNNTIRDSRSTEWGVVCVSSLVDSTFQNNVWTNNTVDNGDGANVWLQVKPLATVTLRNETSQNNHGESAWLMSGVGGVDSTLVVDGMTLSDTDTTSMLNIGLISQIELKDVVLLQYGASEAVLADLTLHVTANVTCLGALNVSLAAMTNTSTPVITSNRDAQSFGFELAVLNLQNSTQGCWAGWTLENTTTELDMRLLPTPCPSLANTDLTNTTVVELNGTFILYPTETLNVSTSTQIVVRGGCVLLQGQLHLVVSPDLVGNETFPLITSEDDCIEGTFSDIQVDTSQNPQICSAEPTYSPASVVFQMQVCTPEAIQSVPVGAIVGGVVGGVAFIALVILLAIFLYKRKQRNLARANLKQKLTPKEIRKTLGPEAMQSIAYDNEGRSGENALYQ